MEMLQPVGRTEKILVETKAVMEPLGSIRNQDRTVIVNLKGHAPS